MSEYKRLNRIYNKMKERCSCPNNPVYKYYGGRGITVCDEWLCKERIGNKPKGWLAFKAWALNNGYRDDLSIDRIDVNKGYFPENCRWVTQKIQANNTRSNRLVTYNGRTRTLSEWCDELGLKYHRIQLRLNSGMSVKNAFEEKENMRLMKITYKGKTQSLKEWCIELNLDYRRTYSRLKKYNLSVGQAFESKRVNARTNLLTYRNKTQSLANWCKELNLNYKSIYTRINKLNWAVDKALETPIKEVKEK